MVWEVSREREIIVIGTIALLLLLLPLAVVTAGSIKPDINLAWLSSFSQRLAKGAGDSQNKVG